MLGLTSTTVRVAAGGKIKSAPGYMTASGTVKGLGTTTTLFIVGSMGVLMVVGVVTDGTCNPGSSTVLVV